MAVRTRLTWSQEKCLEIHFGGKLSLLYKASVHGFFLRSLREKCYNQGPALVVAYSENCTTGAYVQGGFQDENEVFITLFALQEMEIKETKIGPNFPLEMFTCPKRINSLSGFYIQLEAKALKMGSKICEQLGISPLSSDLIQECEVFRCEDVLDERKRQGIILLRESMLSAVRTYKPYGDLVQKAQILLLGPIGAGKSSFVNSVKSIFHGHITAQASVGCHLEGTSKTYRTYSIMDGADGNSLPFVLCDTVGLSQMSGLSLGDINSILKGHIPDRYKFDSTRNITPNHQNYIHNPLLKDRIHCVAFVFDVNSVENLSYEFMTWIKRIRREIMRRGVPHVALLTHVDTMDLVTKADLIDIYSCEPVKLKLQAVHRNLGIAPHDILVVSNYESEWELDSLKDFLILSALRQMLWTADVFLEDLQQEVLMLIVFLTSYFGPSLSHGEMLLARMGLVGYNSTFLYSCVDFPHKCAKALRVKLRTYSDELLSTFVSISLAISCTKKKINI